LELGSSCPGEICDKLGGDIVGHQLAHLIAELDHPGQDGRRVALHVALQHTRPVSIALIQHANDCPSLQSTDSPGFFHS
jgi:hypothetical protein